MTSYLLAGPAEEPVSLVEGKAFLKVDDAAEDALIATLIGAARLHVEGVTGRALLAQSWRVVLDARPESRVVKLPVSPFISVTEINAVDAAGALHAIPLAQFWESRTGCCCRARWRACRCCASGRGSRLIMLPGSGPSRAMCRPTSAGRCWCWLDIGSSIMMR
ncbi:hypothetical protein N8D56_21730 [Devosia sp. A8/3-2]|nr:hypothetical protein N8D56_21730 [Devosia sp. A8/3-2]